MFKSNEIPQKFSNARSCGKHIIYDRYIVADARGDVAEILTHESEINILLDNFPNQKLHYKYDFPIRSAEEFRTDMLRLGITLKWKHTLCVFCDKIKDCSGGECCEDCARSNM